MNNLRVISLVVYTQTEENMLHKDKITLLKQKLGGAEVGTKTIYCNNIVGDCGEVLAADQLIRKGILPSDIKISQAYRPRFSYGEDISSIPEVALIPPCENCVVVFKK